MSFEPPPNPEAIKQVRQQIRLLAAEIARLSRTADLAPEQFYAEFLNRVVSAMAAVGGAVWVLTDGRRLAPAYQVNLQCANLLETPEGQLGHSRLLQRVLASGEGLLVPPRSGDENPTPPISCWCWDR